MGNSIGVRLAQQQTRNGIRKQAYQLRESLCLNQRKYFPIVEVLELIFPRIKPDFYLESVDDDELEGRMAETVPEQCLIRVKDSVYEAARKGHAWARMVLAHELGHLMFHDASNTSFAYIEKGGRIPTELDPEWQANTFASELMIPIHLLRTSEEQDNAYLVAKHFGVPRSAANVQLRQLAKVDKRHRNKRQDKEKRLDCMQPNRSNQLTPL